MQEKGSRLILISHNDLVVTFNYLFSRRISSLQIYIQYGRPITYPIATYDISDKLLVTYSDRNEYRIPIIQA